MKLTRTLQVSENEFYDFLESDLLLNIHQCTGKELDVKDIKKGMKYSKYDESLNTRIDVMVLDYRRYKVYKSSIKSIHDTITITYRTVAKNQSIVVDFEQHIASFENEKHGKFSEAVYLGRMTDTLYDIQKKIIARRGTIVKTPTISQ